MRLIKGLWGIEGGGGCDYFQSFPSREERDACLSDLRGRSKNYYQYIPVEVHDSVATLFDPITRNPVHNISDWVRKNKDNGGEG